MLVNYAESLAALEKLGINVVNLDKILAGEHSIKQIDGHPKGSPLSRRIYQLQNELPKTRVFLSHQLKSEGEAVDDAIILNDSLIPSNPLHAEAVLDHEYEHVITNVMKVTHRAIEFESQTSSLPVSGYKKFYRADEVEGRMAQLAKYRQQRSNDDDAITFTERAIVGDTYSFIWSQRSHLKFAFERIESSEIRVFPAL